ncbi:MAG: polysaccharide biosynthesis protein [Clostridia bacterium]|nr:polysaccharide biosynthesis protein [Clostridia bacterium]
MSKIETKSSIGSDAVALTASKVIIALIGTVTAMLLARFRTLEEYGTYSQIIMVIDLVSTILLLGLPNSINYFLAKADTDEQRKTFLSVYVTVSTVLTIMIGVSLILALPLIIDYFDNPLIKSFAYVFAVYPWAAIMINSLSNTCIVYGKAKKLMVFNIAFSLCTLLVLLVAKFFGFSFKQYMYAYIAAYGFFAVLSLLWIRYLAGGLSVRIKPQLLKEIFKFSIPIGLASVVGTLNVELDKLVIGRFFTTDEYAIFANAAKELPVTMLATSLTAVLLPRLVRLLKDGENRQAADKWGSALCLSFAFMCIIVGGFFVFAPDVMSLFYSEKYVTGNGIAVFRIYTIILLLRSTYWGIVLNAKGKTTYILIASILTLVLNVIGNVVFYYLFGFVGPAISTFVVTVIMALAQILFTCKIIGIEFKHIFPWVTLLKYSAEMIAFSAAFWAIKKYVFGGITVRGKSIIVSMILGIVWVILYVFINKNLLLSHWRQLKSED